MKHNARTCLYEDATVNPIILNTSLTGKLSKEFPFLYL